MRWTPPQDPVQDQKLLVPITDEARSKEQLLYVVLFDMFRWLVSATYEVGKRKMTNTLLNLAVKAVLVQG